VDDLTQPCYDAQEVNQHPIETEGDGYAGEFNDMDEDSDLNDPLSDM